MVARENLRVFFFYLNARLMYDFRVTVSIFLFVLII